MFDALFFEPILALLKSIYSNVAFSDLGIAIVLLTILIRVVLFPFFYRSAKDQALMRKIQPHVEKIKQKHKNNREEQGRALMELYREHKLNPFSSFLIILVQLPIFFALFKLFRDSEFLAETFINTTFLGMLQLSTPSIMLAVVAGALQYIQGKLSLGKQKNQTKGGTQKFIVMMIYFAPILSFVVLIRLPAALGIYWVISTLFSIGQQFMINKKLESKNEEYERKNTKNGGVNGV